MSKEYGVTYSTDFGAGGDVILIQEENGDISMYCYGFWPSFDEDALAWTLDLDDDEPAPDEYGAIEDLIAAHLTDDSVAILTGVSFEKMRYIGGYAVAVNSKGEKRDINLDSIIELAQEIAPQNPAVTPPWR